MSGLYSSALQSAIYTVLINDGGVINQLGNAIYDSLPTGQVPSLFAHLGEETVLDRSDKTACLRYHDVTITVVTSAPGFTNAKNAAAAICKALETTNVSLDSGKLIRLQFRLAKALRDDNGTERKVNLVFRAVIDEN